MKRVNQKQTDMKSPVNQVKLTGRVMDTPQLTTLFDGRSVCRLRIETTEHQRRDGRLCRPESACHTVKAWGRRAEYMAAQLNAGNVVSIRGRIRYRDIEVRDGVAKTVAEVMAERFELIDLKKRA